MVLYEICMHMVYVLHASIQGSIYGLGFWHSARYVSFAGLDFGLATWIFLATASTAITMADA